MSQIADALPVKEQALEDWITKSDGPVALHLKQRLLPVEDSRIIFPPTYTDIGYNIDKLSNGIQVATIDSVGSQANRLEPLFKSSSNDPKDWLVPQIKLVLRKEACGKCEACEKNRDQQAKAQNSCQNPREVTLSLLDVAHRAAAAEVQCSPGLNDLVRDAFQALSDGNAGPLCTIAPTSLLFGFWDSLGKTGEKRPRLVRSIIRAWDVEVFHAAAQFNSISKWLSKEQQAKLKEELEKNMKNPKRGSEIGLKDAPAIFRQTNIPQYDKETGLPNLEARVLGGVFVKDTGRIEREVTVNLVALRGLRGADDEETSAIRKYLLGLALIAATAEMNLFLREGCLLRYAEEGDTWYEVPRRGEPKPVQFDREAIRQFAKSEAEYFRKKWPDVFKDRWPWLKYDFDLTEVNRLPSAKSTGEVEKS